MKRNLIILLLCTLSITIVGCSKDNSKNIFSKSTANKIDQKKDAIQGKDNDIKKDTVSENKSELKTDEKAVDNKKVETNIQTKPSTPNTSTTKNTKNSPEANSTNTNQPTTPTVEPTKPSVQPITTEKPVIVGKYCDEGGNPITNPKINDVGYILKGDYSEGYIYEKLLNCDDYGWVRNKNLDIYWARPVVTPTKDNY